MSAVKKVTVKMKRYKIVCLLQVIFIHLYDLISQMCSFDVPPGASFQEAGGTSLSIQVSYAIVLKHQSLFN